MKPSIVLAIALLSGSIPLAAQQSSVTASGVQSFGCVSNQSNSGPLNTKLCQQALTNTMRGTQAIVNAAANCPAALKAQHLSDGSMVRTGSSHPKGLGQWLHVTLYTTQGAIATLAVHGFSNKGRMTETNMGSSPDAVRTVTVYLAPAPNGQAGGDVWAPGLTAVASLDLVSLNYDDGTKWNAVTGHTCRVTPDPLMLITAR